MESAGGLELDLCGIVEWDGRCLATFKRNCFLSIAVETLFWCINGIKLPEETSFRLFGFPFT